MECGLCVRKVIRHCELKRQIARKREARRNCFVVMSRLVGTTPHNDMTLTRHCELKRWPVQGVKQSPAYEAPTDLALRKWVALQLVHFIGRGLPRRHVSDCVVNDSSQ
jgi:hypothetical protein